jgi:hypothetical protein
LDGEGDLAHFLHAKFAGNVSENSQKLGEKIVRKMIKT